MYFRKNITISLIAFGLAAGAQIPKAAAEYPDARASLRMAAATESIPELSRQERHYDAVRKFLETEESERTLSDKLAISRSAWALGLVQVTRDVSNEVFAHGEFSPVERSRAVLARAIMELQESRFEEARALAEREAGQLKPSDLRAQFWLVIAESLKEQSVLSRSEEYYQRALDESTGANAEEARYLLAENQLTLGRLTDARYNFAQMGTESPYASRALRRLVQIDLAQRAYEGVLTWISEGRKTFPIEFDQPQVHFANITALIKLDRTLEARKALDEFQVRHSENDAWFLLASSAVEGHEIQSLYPQTQLAGSQESEK